jgi:hypothetical protein
MTEITKAKEYLGSHKERGTWVAWQRLDWDWWVVTKNGFNPIPFFEEGCGVITKKFLKTKWLLGRKKKIQAYSDFIEYRIYPKKQRSGY